MVWRQLRPPLIQESLQLWVDVGGQDHGGALPVCLASLVVAWPVANDPASLLILEQGLAQL